MSQHRDSELLRQGRSGIIEKIDGYALGCYFNEIEVRRARALLRESERGHAILTALKQLDDEG